ncbi:hypothetical protein ROU88_05565 [Macrococcus capreoli]
MDQLDLITKVGMVSVNYDATKEVCGIVLRKCFEEIEQTKSKEAKEALFKVADLILDIEFENSKRLKKNIHHLKKSHSTPSKVESDSLQKD